MAEDESSNSMTASDKGKASVAEKGFLRPKSIGKQAVAWVGAGDCLPKRTATGCGSPLQTNPRILRRTDAINLRVFQ
ncbi:hypothetical protein, partial [Enterococcus faecium]